MGTFTLHRKNASNLHTTHQTVDQTGNQSPASGLYKGSGEFILNVPFLPQSAPAAENPSPGHFGHPTLGFTDILAAMLEGVGPQGLHVTCRESYSEAQGEA